MRWRTALRLGRVSNLPTVWTNAIAGAALAGGAQGSTVATVAVAMSLIYVAGMWLNDAFDAEIDGRERPGRPIPAGEATAGTVFVGGFLMLGGGVALASAVGAAAGACAALLAGVVTLYDAVHKRTVLSPLLMGAARVLAYGVAACSAAGATPAVLFGAAGLFAHVVALTYAARREATDGLGSAWPLVLLAVPVLAALAAASQDLRALPFALALLAATAFALQRLRRRAAGDVPRAVVTMIAAITLYDGAMVAAAGFPGLAALCGGAFLLTLALQRVAPGT